MKKVVIALAALALASALGFSLGRRSPQVALETAWAQSFVRDPVAAGRVLIGDTELKGVVGVDGLEELCSVQERVDLLTGETIKFPGAFGVKNITVSVLADGKTEDVLGDWFQSFVVDGRLESKDGAVVIYDRRTGEEFVRYSFYEGWPCKWYVPDMDSDQSGMAIEKIEIAVEKVERAK